MTNKLLPILASTVAFTLVAACETKSTPEAEPPPVAKKTVAPEKSHPDCVGPIKSGTPQTLKVGDTEWELNGSTLKLTSTPKNGSLIIGALSDIKEDSPENLTNLEALVSWFKQEKIDLMVVAGDTGLTRMQIEKALAVLAKGGVPVFNIIGNREARVDYRQAMAALKNNHPNVFDLNLVRRIDTPVVDIVSQPGYFNSSYIHATDGCPYYADDLTATAAVVKSCDSPVLVISHGGPKQTGPNGIDRTAEGENVGDPGLTRLLKDHQVPFGIFGNIHEAGGRATDLDGTKVLPPSQPHAALYLNPGPADAVRWVMNDKTESVGMGALLTFKDGKATYKIHRLALPED